MSNEEENPLVSVVIPTYKRPDMLGRAIDSVLNQTYENLEIIVVDDNDENSEYREETEEFMDKYTDVDKLVYLKHKENKNGSAARNTGIRNARGKYIAFLDDDDKWLSKKIEKQILKIKKAPENYKAIYCGYIFNSAGNKYFANESGDLTKNILKRKINTCAGSTLLIEKNVFNKDNIGFFDETFNRHQDLEFLLRYFTRYKILTIKRPLAIISGHHPPRAKDYEITKNKFLRKFDYLIKKFSLIQRKKIYAIQYYQLANIFVKDCDIKNAFKYFLKASLNFPFIVKQYIIFLKNLVKYCLLL